MEEWVEGGTALLLSICCCPPARLPSSARAEEGPLSEEQKGERVFVIQSLPHVVQGAPRVHISVHVHRALDAEGSRRALVGIYTHLGSMVCICPRENNAHANIITCLRHIVELEKNTQESQADVNPLAVAVFQAVSGVLC